MKNPLISRFVIHLFTVLTFFILPLSCSEDEASDSSNNDLENSLELPVVATAAIENISESSATSGGQATDDGGAPILVRGVCWSTEEAPTTADSKSTDGTGTGTFTSSIINLIPNTLYFVRAYATNESGTSYGDQQSFTTAKQIDLPIIETLAVQNITISSAASGGNITSHGEGTIHARGVCWSTQNPPTLDDNKSNKNTEADNFSSTLTDLESSTHYYVRAYATNEKGTAYGETLQFISGDEPTVTDIVGNVYQTVRIGDQLWMAQNLKTFRWKDGERISYKYSTFFWNDQFGALNYAQHASVNQNDSIYGYCYNGYAILNTRGLCPEGWRVPYEEDWEELIEYLGGEAEAGGKMKATTIWNRPNAGADNSSGFSVYPGGAMGSLGNYYGFLETASFWARSSVFETNASRVELHFEKRSAVMTSSGRQLGNFCRCIKE